MAVSCPGPRIARSPFLSPDGQSVGLFPRRAVKRLALGGGAPVTIASVANPFGAHWAADGSIYYARRPGIMRVTAGGGTPAPRRRRQRRRAAGRSSIAADSDTLVFSVSRPSVFTQRNRWDYRRRRGAVAQIRHAQGAAVKRRRRAIPEERTSRLRGRGWPERGAVRSQTLKPRAAPSPCSLASAGR